MYARRTHFVHAASRVAPLRLHHLKRARAHICMQQVRNFCFHTGGMKLHDTGALESHYTDTVAFGDINFRQDDHKPLAKFALVRDIYRTRGYQSPGTSPHLLR
jgi:hypothetical protein